MLVCVVAGLLANCVYLQIVLPVLLVLRDSLLVKLEMPAGGRRGPKTNDPAANIDTRDVEWRVVLNAP
jgi:hypothetical protein